MASIDIYGLAKKLDRNKKRIENDSGIYKPNRLKILEFLSVCSATGLSLPRQCFYADRLLPIGRLLNDLFPNKLFQEATKQDFHALVERPTPKEKLGRFSKPLKKAGKYWLF